MRAEQITFTDIGKVAVTTTEISTALADNEVLVAAGHVGICGSDLAVLTGHHPWTRPPVVTGHEMSGSVLAVGAEVARVQVGDQVVVNPLRTCGTCLRCRQGVLNQCESAAVRGFRIPGAASSRLVLTESEVHRIPPTVSAELACLAEPLAAAWHAATRSDLLDEVAIIGAGSIGQLVLAAQRYRGAGRITVIEPDAGKRSLAHAQGADVTFASVAEAVPEHPFSAVFDCVTHLDTLEWAVRSTIAGGQVVTVGVPSDATELPLPRMQRFEIALLGSGLYTPTDLDTAIDLIATQRVDVAALISEIHPLSQVALAYSRAQQPDSVKVMVDMRSY